MVLLPWHDMVVIAKLRLTSEPAKLTIFIVCLLQKKYDDPWSQPTVMLLSPAFPGSAPAGTGHVTVKHTLWPARRDSRKAGISASPPALNMKLKAGCKSGVRTASLQPWGEGCKSNNKHPRVPGRLGQQMKANNCLLPDAMHVRKISLCVSAILPWASSGLWDNTCPTTLSFSFLPLGTECIWSSFSKNLGKEGVSIYTRWYSFPQEQAHLNLFINVLSGVTLIFGYVFMRMAFFFALFNSSKEESFVAFKRASLPTASRVPSPKLAAPSLLVHTHYTITSILYHIVC